MDNRENMPLGFAFQLALNQKAMDNFAKMQDGEKNQVMEAARNVNTKEQMQGIVDDLGRLS